MATIKLKQGDDKKVTLQIVKNGNPVSLANTVSVKAVLYVGSMQQKIYSDAPSNNEGVLEVAVTPTNELSFFVERADSVNFPIGSGFIEVLVAFDDTQFPDGNRVETFTIQGVYVQKGNATNIDIP